MTTTMTTAADAYLTKIGATHTPSTNATYRRNFDRVITPYFGKDTPIAGITTDEVTAFLASDALLRKPTGEPRATPTLDQITGLFRAFLHDATTSGLVQEGLLPEGTFPRRRRERRHEPRLCENCKALIDGTPATPASNPAPTVPATEATLADTQPKATRTAAPEPRKSAKHKAVSPKPGRTILTKAGAKSGKAPATAKPAKAKAAKKRSA